MKHSRPFGKYYAVAAIIFLMAAFIAPDLSAQSSAPQSASPNQSTALPRLARFPVSAAPADSAAATSASAQSASVLAVAGASKTAKRSPPGPSVAPNQFPVKMKPLVPGKTDQQAVHAEVAALFARLTPKQMRRFKLASAMFPSFCQGWTRKLHDRELNNLAHLQFQEREGWETATYIGYGPVQTCECKESNEGIPIGKLTYQEYSYYMAGKTLNEAKHAEPKVVGTTKTLEIFSWDKNKWFY